MTKKKKKERTWYSISVASVRRAVTIVVFFVVLVAGYLGFQRVEIYILQRDAWQTIEEATELTTQLRNRDDYRQIYTNHRDAWTLLEEAREEYEAEAFDHALAHSARSLAMLKSVLDVGKTKGTHRFLSLQGSVEIQRRGRRGAWRRARSQDTLRPGDWVKTSTDGTAEILFPDGSVYTLRQNTMVHLGGSSQPGEEAADTKRTTDIVFGWVELNTAEAPSTVATPKSQARVRSDSEAMVSYSEARGEGRFAAYAGGLEVRSASGQSQELGPLQQVEQVGDLLSAPKPLPGKPKLLGPPNEQEIDFDAESELQLAWQATERAQRYALQVSQSQLFASNIIDDLRSKTTARVGIRGEGSFFWQVAAVDREGAQGPWSNPGTFRVVSLRGIGEADDQTPPELEIRSTETYGALVIVNGKTEPGAKVTINGEAVSLRRDGSFSKTVQMTQEGWGFVEVKATDAWDNEAIQRVQVFIDAF
ncbi:MAG: FecR domain-containing protein [bacterium]|nr:FecR domain-containing protein [bacterium]